MKADNVCFVALLAVSVIYFQNIDGKRCVENYTCPNTTLNINNANVVERNAAFRQFVSDLLTSRFLSGASNTAQKFIQLVLSHLTTDSQSLLNIFTTFSFKAFPYLLYAPSTPPLCILARNVNGSVDWVKNRNGKQIEAALTSVANNINTICLMLETTSLLELGCDNVTIPSPIPDDCERRGHVFDINAALDLFGQSLPSCLVNSILDLYESPIYIDKVLSVAMTVALTPEAQYLISPFDINQLLEPSYMILNNNVSSCCCSELRARFDALFSVVTSIINSSVINAIENPHLFDQFATEAEL